MTRDTRVVPLRQPDEVDDPLTAVLRDGARRLLAQAVEAEAEAFLAGMRGLRLPDGPERLGGDRPGPERLVQTGGSARCRCGGSSCATGMPARRRSASASPRRCCRAGRGGPVAW